MGKLIDKFINNRINKLVKSVDYVSNYKYNQLEQKTKINKLEKDFLESQKRVREKLSK